MEETLFISSFMCLSPRIPSAASKKNSTETSSDKKGLYSLQLWRKVGLGGFSPWLGRPGFSHHISQLTSACLLLPSGLSPCGHRMVSKVSVISHIQIREVTRTGEDMLLECLCTSFSIGSASFLPRSHPQVCSSISSARPCRGRWGMRKSHVYPLLWELVSTRRVKKGEKSSPSVSILS